MTTTSTIHSHIPNEIRKHLSIPSLERRFIGDFTTKENEHQINVLQWNILAQALSYPEENFVRVKHETVAYENRKWRILEQILAYQPDLCSLEEMDIYDCFLKEQLTRYGYRCFFTPKPNSKCLHFEDCSENFKGPDGTLLCYRENLFREVDRHNSNLPNDGRFGRQVFSILQLEYKPLSKPLIFVGTHFKAKKQYADSRTNQARALVKCLNDQFSSTIPIIVAGDFNGDSDETFYQILSQAGYRSAYRDLMNGHEPSFTTWKFKAREQRHEKEESRTIDYIFYRSNDQLTPIAYLSLPTKMDIGPDGLPSDNYPSDHLALQSIFSLKN